MSDLLNNQPDSPVVTQRHRRLAFDIVASLYEQTYAHLQRWVREGGTTHVNNLERAAKLAAVADADGYARCNELLQQVHAEVAGICERLGDNPTDVPCDVWRVWEHIQRLQATIVRLRTELAIKDAR